MKYSFLVLGLLLYGGFTGAQPKPEATKYVNYTVKQGETLYSLSKAFDLSQTELIAANPILKNGLKQGQVLSVPVVGKPLAQEELPSFYTYKVKKGNTLHYIAKRFGVTVDDILKYNPEARNGIRKKDVLRIPDRADLERIRRKAETAPKTELVREPVTVDHQVSPGETLYGISRRYKVAISEIIKLNPQAGERLTVGMNLKIPVQPAQETADTTPKATTEMAVEAGSFFVHLVQSGETFWSLEQKYKTTKAELQAYNPALQEGLKAGLRIRIPYKNVPDFEVVPENKAAFSQYTVQRGETVYGLAKRFDLTIAELKQVNPVLEYRGLVEGETILIPREEQQPETTDSTEAGQTSNFTYATPELDDQDEQENYRYSLAFSPEDAPAVCQPNPAARFEQYDVALLLPLYLEANDTVNRVRVLPDPKAEDYEEQLALMTDSFTIRENRIVYPRSESFLEFYEGVLLAVDSMKRAGMNIRLHVFDTNQSAAKISSILYQPSFKEVDLIIGPVFPELQGPVADYAKMRGIPMVSPLSSSGNLEETNPFYFKINPTKEFLIQKTANYIADEYFDKNLIVLSMGNYQHLPEAKLVDLTREKFFFSPYRDQSKQVLFHEYNLEREGSLGLSRILSKDQENVFIIPSATEAQVSVAVTNLNAVAENYPVSLIGLSNFQRYKSIQTEYYHHLQMNLLSPYYVDYRSPVVNRFLPRFRTNFNAEPSQFSYQGYDVAFYFMSALYNYGKDFIGCLPYHQVDLTQGEFQFEKVNRDGGYMNSGLFILKYQPDYSIRMNGVIGRPLYQISGTN
ncbi:LysM peptidoglycan-binding domain-containing protein [Mangrovibacterium marinum]|uniref:ABC-type branched-subunit amino acid transport system substrate-binding protein n=1 Tax=Mangrovibacterium marinum TaxID=1639118 RepID=A0A2T5BY94_9BACT|nr:LysM peptidoglycan-binding domain-containing protein [Mangrovibacterium marinum]PTN06785.1 ABC-type branched-subunit amino acid transport system substrate-binding protein [Mangrovibacterium marinum]